MVFIRKKDIDFDRIFVDITGDINASTFVNQLVYWSDKGKRSVILGEKTILVLQNHYERQQLRPQAAGNSWVDHGLIFPNTKGAPISACHLY
jgi:hypothetical protein